MLENSTEYRIEVGRHGRITLPSKLRQEYNIQEGDSLTLYKEEGGLKLETSLEAMRKVQDLIAPYLENIESPLEDFLTMRREAFEQEETEFKRWEQK